MLQSADITKSLPSVMVGAMSFYNAPAVSLQPAQEEQKVTVSGIGIEASVTRANDAIYEVLSHLYEINESAADQIVEHVQQNQSKLYLFLIERAESMIKKHFGNKLILKLDFDSEMENTKLTIFNSLEFDQAYNALDLFFDELLSSGYKEIFKEVTFINEPFYGL